MSGIDVHDLAKESLPAGRFPVGSRADFRFFLAPEAREREAIQARKISVEERIEGALVALQHSPYQFRIRVHVVLLSPCLTQMSCKINRAHGPWIEKSPIFRGSAGD